MKFRVTLKDPNGPYVCIEEAATQSLPDGLDNDEHQELLEARRTRLSSFVRPWIRYGEYVTIEFDMEAGTATVVKEPSEHVRGEG